jgi:hypothetical protein
VAGIGASSATKKEETMTQKQKNQIKNSLERELNEQMTQAHFARQDGNAQDVDYWEAEVRSTIAEAEKLGISL